MSTDRQLEAIHYHLRPGYVFVNAAPSLVSAELGSGVAVCLWDRVKGIGGMGHFQLPKPQGLDRPSALFGVMAVTTLIRMLLKLGARPENLEAQIYGGGHRHPYAKDMGRRNVKIARRLLRRSHIPIVSEDTGGLLARRLLYHTRTNEVLCLKTPKSNHAAWYPHYPN